MIGLTTLSNALDDYFNGLPEKEQLTILKGKKHLEVSMSDDWLLPFFHQTDIRQPIAVSDAVAYCKICEMIQRKEIYLKMVSVENFAFTNSLMLENTEILSKTRLFYTELNNGTQNSDGTIRLKSDMTFTELGIDSEACMNEALHQTIVKKHTIFPIEIGTMPLSKFWGHLVYGGCLARLPYEVKSIKHTPYLALFTKVS